MRKFKLPSFALVVRDLSLAECVANARGIAEGRDYFAVEIRAVGLALPPERELLTLYVGSPVIMTHGHVWDEAAAARSAISFANALDCFDIESEREWSKTHGEDLSNEAFCHRILGKELRQ